MSLPRSVADVLADHVTLQVECIDRMYLNVYQPRLQHELGVVGFFKGHRGMPVVSGALMDPISKQFVAGIHDFAHRLDMPLVSFRAGERKDDVAQRYLAGFDGQEGVLFVGRAQEKTVVWRTQKRRNADTGATYPWLVRDTAMVNHFNWSYPGLVDICRLGRIAQERMFIDEREEAPVPGRVPPSSDRVGAA